ncbi:MAG: hypothetical protein ACTSSJ_06790 [Candidatus Odinarchaeia archaeon]
MAERLKCPKCNSYNVVQMENKSKVLAYASHIPIYAKKYVCQDCKYEWE